MNIDICPSSLSADDLFSYYLEAVATTVFADKKTPIRFISTARAETN
jgi:hypothetical protein